MGRNECSFCPNGGTPSSPDKIVSGDFTCQDLHDFVSFLDSDGCSADSNDLREIQDFAYECGCPDSEPSSPASGSPPFNEKVSKCPIQQNAALCTNQLLDTVTEKCDCYAFCDSEFVKCQSAEGGLLASFECSGTPITGCNRAGVASGPITVPTPSADKTKQTSKQVKDAGPNTVVIIIAIGVPVVLALLVAVYYCFTRKSMSRDAKNIEGFDETKNVEPPTPVQAMEGSLSMSDIPMPNSPPAESFSN